MNNIYTDDAVFFYDTIKKGRPYVSKLPRNHESLCFVTKGTLEYEKEGKTELICEGQVGYIARGSVDKSSAYGCGQAEYIAVNFNFDKKSKIPEPSLFFKTACAKDGTYKYEKLFYTALEECSAALPGSNLVCSGILKQIIGMIYNGSAFEKASGEKEEKIKNALEYIKKNYRRADLKISELAKSANISEKHFRRLFFEVYDKTPHEFLRDFRLSKAEILIKNTNRKISDIACCCGFSDVYSFSHCFKKIYGTAPKNLR